MSTTTWINSEDRGLQYGDGLFETVGCLEGRPRWLPLHLQRLRGGCERLQLRFDAFDAFDALGAEIAAHAAGQGRCIGKLILTRGLARRRGFRVAISSVRLGMNPLLAGLKHLNSSRSWRKVRCGMRHWRRC